MLNNITMGQYYPVDSKVHRLDPRIKLILTIVFIVVVFMAKTFAGYAVILGFVARALEGIPINQTELFPELERDDAYSRLEKISNGIKDGLHKELIKMAENPPKRKNDSRKTKTDPTE